MAAIYSVVQLEPKSHLIKDRVDWTAAFRSPTLSVGATSLIVKARWQTFLTAMGTYISSAIDRTALSSHYSAYELDDAALHGGPMGSPVDLGTLTVGNPISGGENYPQECAVVCSYHANVLDVLEEDPSGRPAARRRGRFYFGPLISAGATGADQMWHVKSTLTFNLATAMTALCANAGDDVRMQVWSRRDGVLRDVVAGHIDDEFDTQRRRGLKASVRSTWSV